MKPKLFFSILLITTLGLPVISDAQSVLFDFDNAPVYTPLPINQTVNGITARFAGTGQGYSIQSVSTATVVPVGFTGNFIFPSSINLADLLIRFDQKLTDFSIWYSCQELACDDAATMRVTAFLNGIYVGTNTKVAANPGTWPVDTLSCSFAQGFDSVVVHYDSHPPTCQDYGVIFIADNMRVTPFNATGIINPEPLSGVFISPNPVTQFAYVSFSLLETESIKLNVYDMTGRLVKNIFEGNLSAGEHQFKWDIDAAGSGLYYFNFTGDNFSKSCKLIVAE